jgi:biotin transport system substrate-specific component
MFCFGTAIAEISISGKRCIICYNLHYMDRDRLFTARSMAAVAMMAALTAIGSWCSFRIPVIPAPITLQTLFVLLSGFLLGPRLGPLSMAVYLLMGCAGVPVFSEFSAGPGILLGPTGGFLVGFIPASLLCGLSAQLRPHARATELLLTSLISLVLIYVPGVIWLRLYFSWGLQKTMFMAVLPYLPGDIIKALICAFITLRMRAVMGPRLGLMTRSDERDDLQ